MNSNTAADQRDVAVVTGAAHGIGLAVAMSLIKNGYRVLIADKDQALLRKIESRLGGDEGLQTCCVDVAQESAVKNLFARVTADYGRLDLLVNNAANANPKNGPLENLSLADWHARIAVNLTGTFLCVRAALPLLKKSCGSIINMSSTRSLMSEPHTEAYAATKGGLDAFTHALAISYGPAVRVNAIRPGWIDTRDGDDKSPLSKIANEQHPVGRVGEPEDIANLVVFLASKQSSFITGQIINVDGGMTRKMIYEE